MTLRHTTTTAPGATTNACPRCGRGFYGGYNVIARHAKVCRHVPEPAELARIFRQEQTLTAPDLAKRYGCGVAFIYGHLKAGGISAAFVRARGSAAQGVGAKYRQRALGTRLCSVCELVLKHAAVPAGDGEKCGWCASGR